LRLVSHVIQTYIISSLSAEAELLWAVEWLVSYIQQVIAKETQAACQ